NSLGTDLGMWDPQMPVFAERFRVIRYDARGHGRSDASAGPYTLERLSLDLIALLDALDIARAHVCGLSLGGLVAQWVAVYRPDRVNRRVLATPASRIGSATTWAERIAAVRAGGMGAVRDAVVARFLSERFRREHPEETGRIAEMVEATPAEG